MITGLLDRLAALWCRRVGHDPRLFLTYAEVDELAAGREPKDPVGRVCARCGAEL